MAVIAVVGEDLADRRDNGVPFASMPKEGQAGRRARARQRGRGAATVRITIGGHDGFLDGLCQPH